MLQAVESIKKDYTIVRTKSEYDRMMTHIEYHDYLSFDTETTGLNVRKDKVIGYSFSGAEGIGYYLPIYFWCTMSEELQLFPHGLDYMKPLQALCRKELLMWNASYDIRITKNDLGIDLTDALIADVMLMKHTVEEEGTFKLKEVAIEKQKFLGIDVETAANEEQIKLKANVAKNGGSTTKANYEMYKADLEVMGKYAAADADLTLRLGNYYMEKLREEGLESFFFDDEVMPLYKEVTIKMEDKGIHLDMNLIEQTKKEILADINKLEKQVINELVETEEFNSWLLDTARAKYPPKKTGSFAQELLRRSGFDLPVSEKTGKYSLSKKNIDTLPESLEKLFLQDPEMLGPEDLEKMGADNVSISLWEQNEGAMINISSKKQMGDFVFNYMGIKPLSTTTKGAPQFDDEMIQHLEEDYNFQWAKTLGNYNKLIKINGAYIDRFLDAQEDGIFYPSFFQHRTISGRYGSDMQQLNRPKEEGELDPIVLKYNNVIRKFFISGTNRKFVDNDYESLEPHVFAHVSGDEGIKDIFRKGYDFYSSIAIPTEGLVGFSADKKADNYLGKLDKPRRQKAKAYALGVPYGMKAYALGMSLDVDQNTAQELIDGYLNGFPSLKQWMIDSEEFVKKHGYIRIETGRIRHLPKVKELYDIHGDNLLDFKYRNKIQAKYQSIYGLSKSEAKDKVTGMYKDYKNGLNNAKNVQIQGLSASIVNRAAIAINREFNRRGIDAWVSLQIHDQLVMNVPEDAAEECKKLVQDIMENNYKLSVKLKAPAELGVNLYEAH